MYNDFREYSELFHSTMTKARPSSVYRSLSDDFKLLNAVALIERSDKMSKRDGDVYDEIMRKHNSEKALADGTDRLTDSERQALKKIISHYN